MTSLSLFTFMHWRREWQPTPVFLPGESVDGGTWWAAVHGISQSRTRLKQLSSSSSSSIQLEGFPGSSAGRESTCHEGDPDSIPMLRRSSGGGHDNPLQYSCLENPPGHRSLVGYGPWGCKESDTTELWQLSTARHTS